MVEFVVAVVQLNLVLEIPHQYHLFLFPNHINLCLYIHDELWMYEINFVINHNLVYLHNVNLVYFQDIAKIIKIRFYRTKKKK